MALKLSVKIGDVTNLSDARYAAGMGVDYIGFNINEDSKHYLQADSFKEILNWVSGVGIIGEVGNNNLPQGYEQFLPETGNPDLLAKCSEGVLRIACENKSLQEIQDSLQQAPQALFYLLELTQAQLEKYTRQLAELCSQYAIYLSLPFTETLLQIVVETIQPKGIEIKGSLEEQPGLKDYDGIADVLEWLEMDD